DKLRVKNRENKKKLAKYRGVSYSILKIFLGNDPGKRIAELENKNKALQKGDLKSLSVFYMPGYVLQRRFDSIGRSGIHKVMLSKNFELHGKKHAEHRTKQLLAKLLSYPVIGLAALFMISSLLIGTGNDFIGLIVLTAGTLLLLFVCYAMYDDLSDKANKRREAIERQFPGVVSKLALLITSGMIMNRAWKETAYSQQSELYKEMQKTSEELENLVSPEIAYGNFISRCNTKETAKLASAIMQNLSKGNAEIGNLLKGIAKEAWLERRHIVKRDSERAKSKLMIPTMLLFLAILVMIMVPIAMNLGGI
ncbi:MAG: type II secretion system F family protein, partial [Oscillospiraceae bacterium]|nr:type II secretion system F family protein [Oscillospiraceae bacterium]